MTSNKRNTTDEVKTPQQLALEKFGTDWHDNGRTGIKSALRRRIKRHTEAQVALSWAGGKDPDEREEIELEAQRAANELRSYLDSMFDRLK